MTGVQLCLWPLISGKEIWAPNITENCAWCQLFDPWCQSIEWHCSICRTYLFEPSPYPRKFCSNRVLRHSVTDALHSPSGSIWYWNTWIEIWDRQSWIANANCFVSCTLRWMGLKLSTMTGKRCREFVQVNGSKMAEQKTSVLFKSKILSNPLCSVHVLPCSWINQNIITYVHKRGHGDNSFSFQGYRLCSSYKIQWQYDPSSDDVNFHQKKWPT